MFSGPCVVINQLIKSIWKVVHFKNSKLYMLGKKKYQSNRKWPRLIFLKIWPKFGHSKVHNYLFVKFFVVNFLNSYLFFHHVSYIESLLKIYWDENKKCIWMLIQNANYSPHVHFKSPLLYDWCMFIEFCSLINILFQVSNLNP
jgi:hypothetical protein